MNATTLGIDLAKNTFSLHGVDAHGKPVLRKDPRPLQAHAVPRSA